MVLILPITAPEEGLIFTANNVRLKMGDQIIDNGTIYISQNALAWQPNDIDNGISIPWKQISVHGVASDPSKCVFFMLDHKVQWNGVYGEQHQENGAANGHANDAVVQADDVAGAGGDVGEPMDAADNPVDLDRDEGNGSDEPDDDEEEQTTECWLIPDDINSVETMYRVMAECQALHPDSGDSLSSESDFMEEVDDDNDDDEDNALGRIGGGDNTDEARNHMRNMSLEDQQRFEDADG